MWKLKRNKYFKNILLYKMLWILLWKRIHSLKEGHDILIPVKKVDSCCFEKKHNNNNIMCYCKDDNINICFFCKNGQHKKHKILNL